MTSTASAAQATLNDDEVASTLCLDAVQTLEAALKLPPLQLTSEVDLAERAVARLRDHLIDQLRQAPSGPAAPHRRAALEQVNAGLSLIAGAEYPVAGIQRKLLEQARDVLKQLLGERPAEPRSRSG
jgi:hypothetical protein